MSEILSRIVAELFENTSGGEELSSKTRRLREELKKVIARDDSTFGKLRELVESFKEIIPGEKQRYQAAIKALATTSKVSRQEIVQAVSDQVEELKVLEKSLMPALPVWRDELKVMEARTKERNEDLAKLRERIGWLQDEEKGILTGLSTRKKEMELAEKAVRQLFSDMGAEISSIKAKLENPPAETAAAQTTRQKDALANDIPGGKKKNVEQKIEFAEPSAPQDTEWQKKCSQCGGRMDFHMQGEMWQCYSCGYEELKKDEVRGELSRPSEPAPKAGPSGDLSRPFAGPLADMSFNAYQQPKNTPSPKKKTCPACHKKMLWYEDDKTWRCSHCEYERRA